MSEKKKSTIIERFLGLVMSQALGGITRPLERLAKRVARAFGLILGGIVIAVIGISFLSVGTVKWLAMLMPSWLAWILVGTILFLVGVMVALIAYFTGRS